MWPCLMISFALVGCGNDDANVDAPSAYDKDTDTVSIYPPVAIEQYSQLLINDDEATVSLFDSISDPQNLPMSLIDVKSESDNCADPTSIDANALAFEVEHSHPSVCVYRYTVQNNPSEAEQAKAESSYSYVLTSDTKTSAVLSALSAVSVVNTDVTINLREELGAEFPDDYYLEPDLVVVGSGSATVTDSDSTEITYSASNDKGISRIVYTLSASDNSDVKIGYIDIAVSGEGNSAPSAEDFVGPEGVVINNEISIDVSDYISDVDGDGLQLTDVKAFNATVAPKAPDDVTNTSFTFIASDVGSYDVSYYVYDHRNGYAVGTVRITVSASVPWDDIVLEGSDGKDGETYTAPLDAQSSDAYGIPYQDTETETITIDGIANNYNIALFNNKTAEFLCSYRGMVLPSLTQLETLYAAKGNIKASDNWPTENNYWTEDSTDGNILTYNLADGTSSILAPDQTAIVTCSYPGHLEVTPLTTGSAYTTSSSSPESGYYHQLNANVTSVSGVPLENKSVYLSSTEPNISISPSNALTDGEGNASFHISSTKEGTFDINATYFTQTVSSAFQFIYNAITDFYLNSEELVIAPGDSDTTAAYATYSSGTSIDMTGDAAWTVTPGDSSVSDDFVTIKPGGVVVANRSGYGTITATYDEVNNEGTTVYSWSDDASVTVTREYESVYISPSSATLSAGGGAYTTFNICYKFTDGSDSCNSGQGLTSQEKTIYRGVTTSLSGESWNWWDTTTPSTSTPNIAAVEYLDESSLSNWSIKIRCNDPKKSGVFHLIAHVSENPYSAAQKLDSVITIN